MTYVLALEASTQSAKAAVVSADGACIVQVERVYPAGVSDIATMDAAKVYDELIAAGRQAVADAKAAGVPDIGAAGLCTIWQSLLPVDADGEPLARAQTWAHTGAGAFATDIRLDPARCRAYYRDTGCIPHSQLSAMQAGHLREENPELFHSAAQIGSVNSYILRRMTGQARSPRCTMAGSGWLNVRTHDWDGGALDIAGVTADRLPPLCDATDALPLLAKIAAALGVGNISIAAGGGDGGLNQIGSGALREGIMTCSVGTSGALRVAGKEPVLSDPPATWSYYIDKGWFVSGAATSGACNCVDWARAVMLGGRSFAELEKAMADARDNWKDAPVFLPFLWGERAPGWDDARTGGYVGLRSAHGTGELYYAALEGVLMLLRMCYGKLTAQAGEPDVIALSGGITNSQPWMRMAADVFGRPVEISVNKNASLMGAAALALVSCGAMAGLEDFSAPTGEVLQPDPAMAEHYAARYARFVEAYGRG